MKITPEMRQNAQNKLQAFRAENADLYDKLYKAIRCSRCGRILTDPESIKAKIGPECATKGAS